MPAYEFVVELTAGDNTAFTVLGALRGLGYERLERVERGDVLRLHVSDAGLTADECAAALTRAEIVFNQNRDRLARSAPPETGVHEAVVADVDDDAAPLADLLRERFGIDGLERVERATAWRLFERGGSPASGERLEWACTILLANKFSQSFVVRKAPTRVAVAARPEKMKS